MEYAHRRPRRKNKIPLVDQTRKTIRSLIITLSLMIVVLLIAFFVLTNESAQKGYALQQIQLENEELKDENQEIMAKITQTNTFGSDNLNEKTSEMAPAEIKTFVTKEDNELK